MRKYTSIPVVYLAVLGVVAVVVVLNISDSRKDFPTKELKYIQLNTKGAEFALSDLKKCTRDTLLQQWGNPDEILAKGYGDVWKITDNAYIVVYYSTESQVEQIELQPYISNR